MGSISDLASDGEVDLEESTPVIEQGEVPTDSDDFEVQQELAAKPITVDAAMSGGEFLELLLDKIEDITGQDFLKMMLYSDPGAGKTSLLGQVPHNLIIDAETGTDSILEIKKKGLLGEGTQRLPYKTFAGLEMTVEAFHKNPDQLKHFKTISIDSMSNLHKRGLQEVVYREWEKNPNRVNRYVAETEHHTENNEHIRQLVQSLIDLERNFIMTAHKRTIEPKGKPAKTFPDFSEKLANTLAGMVGIVGYMYIANIDDKDQRVIKFHPSPGTAAKCRFSNFPVNLVDPTWAKISELWDNREVGDAAEGVEL